MRAKTTIRSIAFPLLLAMVFLFGTDNVLAQNTRTWDGGGGTDTRWSTAANWDGGTGTGIVPTATDYAVIPTGYTVTFDANATIANLSISGNVTFISDFTLTVTGIFSLTDATLNLGYDGTTANGFIIQLGSSTVPSAELNLTNSKIEYYSANPNTDRRDVLIRAYGSISMNNLLTSYIGTLDRTPNVSTRLERFTGQFRSDARFEGDVILGARVNIGQHSVWLGKEAENIQLSIPSVGETFFGFTDEHLPNTTIGRLVKSARHWMREVTDPSDPMYGYEVWDESVEYFIFETGKDVSQQAAMSMGVDINVAYETTFTPSATKPFRGVSVRYVKKIHPKNMAVGNKIVAKYWVVQPVGFAQVNNPYFPTYLGPPTNDICYAAEFNTSDVSTPSGAYAAIWSENLEDITDPLPTGVDTSWYTYGSIFGGHNINGRLYVVMCPTFYFGDLTIGEGSNQVPVELTSFSARYIRDNVELSWQTATELNNYGFAIERSRDGEIWEEIDFVNGAGNSYSPKSYTYTDLLDPATKRAPRLAYRLRQIDRDGTTEYSNIVFVTLGALPTGVELHEAYPNPFNPSTTVSFSLGTAAPVKIKVFDIYGREVAVILDNAALEAGVHTAAFRASALPSGSYIVVLNAAGVTRYQRVVLNK
ncbi:MAG: T9SS type A sorting domain-containing protein [Bacteroidia bacterium]|nr:T9SS type A sorting domain-containing protein [Bacteroidia bacterium]